MRTPGNLVPVTPQIRFAISGMEPIEGMGVKVESFHLHGGSVVA